MFPSGSSIVSARVGDLSSHPQTETGSGQERIPCGRVSEPQIPSGAPVRHLHGDRGQGLPGRQHPSTAAAPGPGWCPGGFALLLPLRPLAWAIGSTRSQKHTQQVFGGWLGVGLPIYALEAQFCFGDGPSRDSHRTWDVSYHM